MLKQPGQELRYVFDGENSSGLSAAWSDLSRHSADAVPTSGPALVMPFLGRANIASIYAQDQLVLAMPLERGALFDRSYDSPLTHCGTCHADRLNGQAAVSYLLSMRAKPILLRAIPVQSQFFAMVENAAAHFTLLETWKRASLIVQGSFDSWMDASFDTKRRKELKRLRNRLSDNGDVQTLSLDQGSDVKPFIDEFLELEASGWKGDRGTALAKDPKLASATHKALTALHQDGKLRFWSMNMNGKAIASLFAFVDGSKASLGKIAYDESFGKYSPGVLLMLDATESFFTDGTITEVDSSAIPNHPMIDRLWRSRIAMADVLVAPANVSVLRFLVTVGAEKMRRTLRAALRHTYYSFGRKSRS